MELGKAFGAVAALKQKSFAFDDLGKISGQVAGLSCKDQRRIITQGLLSGRKRSCILIFGHVNALCVSPTVRRPICRHAHYSSFVHFKGAPFRLILCALASKSGNFPSLSQFATASQCFSIISAKFPVGKFAKRRLSGPLNRPVSIGENPFGVRVSWGFDGIAGFKSASLIRAAYGYGQKDNRHIQSSAQKRG